MDNLFLALASISFIALIVFAILSLVQMIKKNSPKAKRFLKFSGVTLCVMIVSFIGFAITMDPAEEVQPEKVETSAPKVTKQPTPKLTEAEKAEKEKKEAEEKAAAELKAKQEAEAKAAAEQKAKAEAEAKAKEASIPREHKSALKKAETYAEVMQMSKAGVYDQLTSEYGENFPAEAAQYAIDNLEFDWKENAVKKAKTYADTMNMSNSAIYDQLISDYGEKFTPEEAKYGVDNLK